MAVVVVVVVVYDYTRLRLYVVFVVVSVVVVPVSRQAGTTGPRQNTPTDSPQHTLGMPRHHPSNLDEAEGRGR